MTNEKEVQIEIESRFAGKQVVVERTRSPNIAKVKVFDMVWNGEKFVKIFAVCDADMAEFKCIGNACAKIESLLNQAAIDVEVKGTYQPSFERPNLRV